MRYYATSQLSEHMAETPEGYLICFDVPIARTGVQEYLAEEVPVRGPGETVLVRRDAGEVFAPATIASFEGKSVTVDHPEDFVTPETWRELTMGIAQNVRRGGEGKSDLLLADLLITDRDAIKAVRGGLREISCGYDADYEEISPGVGRQVNIIGNHIALVTAGRCGTRCMITDKEPAMAKVPRSFFDWLRGKPKLQKAFDEALAEESAKDNDIPPKKDQDPQAATDGAEGMEQISTKLDELILLMRSFAEQKSADQDPTTADEDPGTAQDDDPNPVADDDPAAVQDEDPDDKTPTGDRARKRANDAARMRTADTDTVRRAKILAPAMSARVGDSACALKRASLRMAMTDGAIARTVDACLRGSTLDRADCLTLDAAFVAASELAAQQNNRKTGDTLAKAKAKDNAANKPVTPADLNAQNQKYRDSLRGGK